MKLQAFRRQHEICALRHTLAHQILQQLAISVENGVAPVLRTTGVGVELIYSEISWVFDGH